MGRKCCSFWISVSCDGNFLSKKTKNREKVKIFRFPKDPTEESRWIQCLPNILTSGTKYIGICARHWPENYPTISIKGKLRPAVPPSLFGVPNTFAQQLPQIIELWDA